MVSCMQQQYQGSVAVYLTHGTEAEVSPEKEEQGTGEESYLDSGTTFFILRKSSLSPPP